MKINLQNLADQDYLDSIYDEDEEFSKPSYWNGRKQTKRNYAKARKERQAERERLSREYGE